MYVKRQKLLTIEQYAEQQGVSTDIVNACIRSGVITTRSHKGKKYVVDIPASPYCRSPQRPTCGGDEKRESAEQKTGAGSIARLAEKMLQKAAEIKKMTATAEDGRVVKQNNNNFQA